MRLATLLVLTGLVATLLCTVVVLAAAAAQRRAMSRCLATPPGFPRSLSRAGTGVTVEWTLVPPRYTCVYRTPERIVRRPPP